MTDTPPLDTVAVAICAEAYGRGWQTRWRWEQDHWRDVAKAAIDALQLTEEWAGDCIATGSVQRGQESRYCVHKSLDEAEDYHRGLDPIASRLVSPWVVVEGEKK